MQACGRLRSSKAATAVATKQVPANIVHVGGFLPVLIVAAGAEHGAPAHLPRLPPHANLLVVSDPPFRYLSFGIIFSSTPVHVQLDACKNGAVILVVYR